MFVKSLKNFCEGILKMGSIASLAGMVSVVMLQVVARLFFPKVPTWTEEVSRLMLLYTVGFSAGLAVKERAYVNVDILTSRFPAKVDTSMSARAPTGIARSFRIWSPSRVAFPPSSFSAAGAW